MEAGEQGAPSPQELIDGFIAFAAQRNKMLVYVTSAKPDFLLKPSQVEALTARYIGGLTKHHYNALGGQKYLEGRGFANHCRECDMPKDMGNHF